MDQLANMVQSKDFIQKSGSIMEIIAIVEAIKEGEKVKINSQLSDAQNLLFSNPSDLNALKTIVL